MKDRLSQNINATLYQYLHQSVDENFNKTYLGIVEDNMDPLKHGRVRVRLHGLYDDIPANVLPWATPNFPLGAGSAKGSFIVPEIGAVINVTFDDGDIYEPKYDTKCLDVKNIKFEADKDEDYPNSVIFYETGAGDYCKVNRKRGEYTINTAAGVFFKFCENGDIVLSNDASEGGSLLVNLNGHIIIDNKSSNTSLTTNNISTSAFGDISTKSNGGIIEECLDDRETYANHDIVSVAGNDTSIKTKNQLEFGSTKTKMRTNKLEITPAIESVEGFKFSVCEDLVQSPVISVKPEPLGGPFNAIMFDTFTGAPHQGRVMTSPVILPSADKVDILAQKVKITASVTLKYTKLKARETDLIISKYTSIDSQAQMLLNGIKGDSYLETKKANEIKETIAILNKLESDELERKLSAIDGYLTTPIFEDEETKRKQFIAKIPGADVVAKTDITRKSTYKDIIGCGDGLVVDIVETTNG